MSEQDTDEARLIDEAIDLVIRMQAAPDSPVPAEMVRAWRGRSPAHELIWVRVAKAHGASGKILTDRRSAERRKAAGLTRRNVVIGGALGLGALGAGYGFGPGLLLRSRADHLTQKAETRSVALADGSVAILGPDSALAGTAVVPNRRVELLAGMSFFDVAREAQGLFSVQVADLTASARDARFDVSDDDGTLTVAVDRGEVDVRVPNSPLAAASRLQAGEWIAFDRATRTSEQGTSEPGQVAAWRDNLVMADKERLAALVARIGRWIPGRIVFADPFIGAQRISGVFDLKNPMRALEAVVHPAGARVRQVASLLTVISPV